MRAWRAGRPRPTGAELLKVRARQVANAALRRGEIEREGCADCGGSGEEMHHDDYSKPLEVTWLCGRCHRAREGRVAVVIEEL